MSYTKGEKLKPKLEVKKLTWQEKKKVADEEEESLTKLIKEHTRWTTMIEHMDNQQLKLYLKERPESLKTPKIEKLDPIKRMKKVQKCSNTKSSGIMSTVWKFHKKEDK